MTVFRLAPHKVIEVLATVPKDYEDYGLKLMNVPLFWEKTKGEGVLVAVLDTGVDAHHQDLAGQVKWTRNFTSPNMADINDRQGHATHVCGIIAAAENGKGIVGVAPDARLAIAKVIGDSGSGDFGAIAAGIRWAITVGADVINMSLGCGKQFGEIPELHQAVKEAYNAGIELVSAAGNEGHSNKAVDSTDYPAAYPEVWAVAAVDMMEKHASFSSEGSAVDVCTPGVEVISCFPGNRYVKMSGTSMATPYFAGALALLISQFKNENSRRPTHEELRALVKVHCEDLGDTGDDVDYGMGFFNFAYTRT